MLVSFSLILKYLKVKNFVDTSEILELGFSERMINGDLLLGGITFSVVLPSFTSNGFGVKIIIEICLNYNVS